MERIRTLVEKLQNQLEANVLNEDMMLTTQLLYSELVLNLQTNPQPTSGGPFVLPAIPTPLIKEKLQIDPIPQPENGTTIENKVVEVLNVDDKEIEEELEQIKKNAEIKNTLSSNAKPEFNIEEKPIVQERIHPAFNVYADDKTSSEIPSINDTLKSEKTEVSEKLNDTPIKDLKKAISVNDRYVFINELFKGDEATFERSIKTINGFSIYPEAEYWIRRELKLKFAWKDSEAMRQFDQLVRRRFL